MWKRLFDFICSFIGLLVLSPVLITITLFIKGEDGGPAFYKGVRVGRDGHLFRVFKFRTDEVTEAHRFAKNSPFPDIEELTSYVFKKETPV